MKRAIMTLCTVLAVAIPLAAAGSTGITILQNRTAVTVLSTATPLVTVMVPGVQGPKGADGSGGGGGVSSWNDLTDKPATFPPTEHTQSIATVTGLQTALDAKAASSSLAAVATSGAYGDLTGRPALFSGIYTDLIGLPSLFSGSYADLTNKPSIPTALASLTDDSTHRLTTDAEKNGWNAKQAPLTYIPVAPTDNKFAKKLRYLATSNQGPAAHQGCAYDGTYYYLTNDDHIWKRSTIDGANVAENATPLTAIIAATGDATLNHLGASEVYNGYLWVVVDHWVSCADDTGHWIARYNASDLSFVDAVQGNSHGEDSFSALTIDPVTNTIYVSSYCSPKIFTYSLTDRSYTGTITLSNSDIVQKQGLANDGTYLYTAATGGGGPASGIWQLDYNGNVVKNLVGTGSGITQLPGAKESLYYYRDTLNNWDGSSGGSGYKLYSYALSPFTEAITGVTAGTGMTVTTTAGVATVNANVGTAANNLLQLNGSGYLGIGTTPTANFHHRRDDSTTIQELYEDFTGPSSGSGTTTTYKTVRGSAAAPRRSKAGDAIRTRAYGGAYAADDSTDASIEGTLPAYDKVVITEDHLSTAKGIHYVWANTIPGTTLRAERWTMRGNGFFGTASGSTVTAASTITPTGDIFHITGATVIQIISLPWSNFVGRVTMLADTAFSTITGGNIAAALSGAQGYSYTFAYDGDPTLCTSSGVPFGCCTGSGTGCTGKWYPSH